MGIPGYRHEHLDGEPRPPAVEAVYSRAKAAFDWLFAPERFALDPDSGRVEPSRHVANDDSDVWRGLGLAGNGGRAPIPVVVLSSLAPGADTIVAEAALDYRRETGLPVFVRAPLPLPPEIYRESKTFVPGGYTGGAATPAQQRFDRLLERIRAQENWFVEERDVFHVELDDDLELHPRGGLDLSGELTAYCLRFRRPRIDLRFRAAGEFIAAHTHLLIAVYDEDADPRGNPHDLFSPGTRTIVEARREGVTYELLAGANGIQGADRGPVLHIPVDLRGRGGELASMRLLHPMDARRPQEKSIRAVQRALENVGLRRPTGLAPPRRLAEASPDSSDPTDPDWEAYGGRLFRTLIGGHRTFAHENVPQLSSEPGKAVERFTKDRGREVVELSQDARDFLDQLEPLAQIYGRADRQAEQHRPWRDGALGVLAVAVGAAAVSLQLYESMPGPDSRDGVASLRSGVLLAVLIGIGFKVLVYRATLHVGLEERRFEPRAMAEALRVQFYWCAAGIHAEAADQYMQRQHGELSWMRHTLRSAAMSLGPWHRRFRNLSHEVRADLFEFVRVAWIEGQLGYAMLTLEKKGGSHVLAKVWGWALVTAGAVNVVVALLDDALSGDAFVQQALHYLGGGASIRAWCAGLLGLCGGVGLLRNLTAGLLPSGAKTRGQARNRGQARHSGQASIRRGTVARHLGWSYGLLLGALLLVLPITYGGEAHGWPSRHGVWIVLIEAALISGALILSWSERRQFAEHARSNEALAALYGAGSRKLEPLIRRYRGLGPGADRDRAREEIQSLYFELGCEALSENAEWLTLHRARPLEPFV